MPTKEMTYADERRTAQLADQAGRDIGWDNDALMRKPPVAKPGRKPRLRRHR